MKEYMKICLIHTVGKTAIGSDWKPQTVVPVNRLYYIHGGTGYYKTTEGEHRLEKDRLYLFPRNAVYSLVASDDDPLKHSFIDFQFTPILVSQRIVTALPDETKVLQTACNTFLCCAAHIRESGLSVVNDFNSKSLYNLLCASVQYIVNHLIEQNELSITKDELVAKVANDIYKNYASNISTTGLAEKYHISVNKLIEKFRQQTGMTPYALIKQLRLDTARTLLNAGGTLSEVAATVGYSDATSLKHALSSNKKN